jgi:hypothetical protein
MYSQSETQIHESNMVSAEQACRIMFTQSCNSVPTVEILDDPAMRCTFGLRKAAHSNETELRYP